MERKGLMTALTEYWEESLNPRGREEESLAGTLVIDLIPSMAGWYSVAEFETEKDQRTVGSA